MHILQDQLTMLSVISCNLLSKVIDHEDLQLI